MPVVWFIVVRMVWLKGRFRPDLTLMSTFPMAWLTVEPNWL
jgi:hypothetical protein